MTKQIKVGDVVKVVNKGQQYTTYADWATRNSFKDFVVNTRLTGNEQGVVEVIASHHSSSDTLCGINVNGTKHIIGIKGLEFVREGSNKPFDLQLFQRVELRNGEKGIISPNVSKYYDAATMVVLIDCFTRVKFPGEGKEAINKQYEIVKIFDLPDYNSDMLDTSARGKLLWKETISVAPEVIAADLAITEAENSVKAAQVALEAAKAARQAL